jgi:nuclear pore complex protein Nup93
MPQVLDALNALIEITGEQPDVERESDPKAIKERQYASEYLDENPNAARSIEIRKQMLSGSRAFLEKQFLNNLEAAIAKNPKEANLGGVPTTINKIRAYIRVKAARKELGSDNTELQTIGDDYCWALIFYLLRAGLVEEAAQYVRENERAIRSVDRNFPQYMAHFAQTPDRRLPGDLQARINSEYQQRSRIAPENSVDPYRMACFKILGRCEVSRRSLENINQNMEDWVWLQFALAREVPRVEETAGEVFGLEDLKVTITEIGQKHFAQGASEAGPGAGVFFYLQILAGMFEQAIAYLYPHNYIAAVHVAIALDYYGLLRVSNLNAPDSDLRTFKPPHTRLRILLKHD